MKSERCIIRRISHAFSVSVLDLRTKTFEGIALNKLRGAGLAFSWVLVATVVSGAQTTSQQQIQVHYQRAEEALKANHSQEASNEFREILRIDPRNAEAVRTWVRLPIATRNMQSQPSGLLSPSNSNRNCGMQKLFWD